MKDYIIKELEELQIDNKTNTKEEQLIKIGMCVAYDTIRYFIDKKFNV